MSEWGDIGRCFSELAL